MANSVTLTFGYTGTDFTRNFKIENVEEGSLSSVKQNILDLNAAISGGLSSADGLAEFFLSDDYDATDSDNVIGEFNGIVAAQIERQTVTAIDLS